MTHEEHATACGGLEERSGRRREPELTLGWRAAEAAFERARRSAERFAVLSIGVDRPAGTVAPEPFAADVVAWAEAVFDRERVLAFEVQPGLALAIAGADSTERIDDGVRALLERGRERPDESAVRPSLSVGLAHNARGGGTDPDLAFATLLAVAREGERVAALAGGDCWRHSELYELVQRELESVSSSEVEALPPLRLIEPTPAERTVQTSPVVPEQPDDRREIDLLERRLRKVCADLDRTRSELARMQAREEVDSGVASIHRCIQGLSELDPDHERKTELMTAIFQANLALRTRAG